MKRSVSFLLIVTGLVQHVLSLSYKYYLIQQAKTWNDAQTYCRTFHDDMASLESNESLIQIQDEALSWQFVSSAWIGLYKDMSQHTWHWSLGKEVVTTVVQWGQGSPGSLGCAALISDYLWDFECSRQRPFMCYDETKIGSNRYIYYKNFISWFSAQKFCRKHHTDLTTSKDQTEFTTINQNVGDPSWLTWIGLIQDFWVWSDGSNSTIVPWMVGEPDDAAYGENCGYLFSSETGDAVCSNMMPFFCYGIITGQQQLVRMKFQSNQDLNDPTVTAELLNLIYKKLEEHGLKGYVKLKWRKQASGELFHKLQERNNTVDNQTLTTCQILDF